MRWSSGTHYRSRKKATRQNSLRRSPAQSRSTTRYSSAAGTSRWCAATSAGTTLAPGVHWVDFFFQAKDGIRAGTVTGVQTCALPISFVVRAQQSERMKRVGLLVGYNEDDTQGQASVAAFRQKVRELGWTEGGNVLIDTRWAGSRSEERRVGNG